METIDLAGKFVPTHCIRILSHRRLFHIVGGLGKLEENAESDAK